MKTPEYDGLFESGKAWKNQIQKQSPYLVYTVDQLVRLGVVDEQLSLPGELGERGSLLRYNKPDIPVKEEIEYTIFEQ